MLKKGRNTRLEKRSRKYDHCLFEIVIQPVDDNAIAPETLLQFFYGTLLQEFKEEMKEKY